ncbi:response regulator [bacterium]|nr:response regulator [bacterium]
MDIIKYVIVEDDVATSELLTNILKQQSDLKCEGVFHNAKDALAKIPALNPQVVLMDLKLGKDNGVDVIRTLKSIAPHLLFLVITVFEESDKLFESLKAGATGYIVKSARPAEYAAAIRDLAAGGSPLSPGIARKLIASFQNKPAAENYSLTERESEIVDLLAQGLMYKQVAAALLISIDTVRSHIRHIYEKLQVNSRTEAINKVYRNKPR